MSLWIIHEGRVHAPSDTRTRELGVFDVRDLEGVAVGWIEQAGGSFVEPVAPSVALRPVITTKADLYRRCTEEEADEIEVALQAAPVRQRRLFESAQYLDHADEQFSAMFQALVTLFGAERAAVLLARSG